MLFPEVPLLLKLLQRLAVPDLEATQLFPSTSTAASDLVSLAEDLAHLGLQDPEALRACGREILRRRPELSEEQLQVARGAFHMMRLKLQDVRLGTRRRWWAWGMWGYRGLS